MSTKTKEFWKTCFICWCGAGIGLTISLVKTGPTGIWVATAIGVFIFIPLTGVILKQYK